MIKDYKLQISPNPGGKMDEESMMAFMKEMKNTTELSDEEIAALAATKIQENKPKSRM